MNDISLQDKAYMARRRLYTTVFCQCFSPCGKYLAVCDNFGYIAIFSLSNALSPQADTADGSYRPYITFKAHDGPAYALVATEKFLISAGTGNINAWSWADIFSKAQKIVWSLKLPHEERTDRFGSPEINHLVLDEQASGTRLYAAGGDNNVHVWDLEAGQHELSLQGHKDYVHCVALKGNLKECLSASEDGSVRLWDTRRPGESVHVIEPYKQENCARPQYGKWIATMAVDKADDWMVCGGGPKLCLWHLRSLAATTVFDTPNATSNHVMFADDSVISAGSEPYVYHWSVNGDQRAKVPSTPTAIYNVAINAKSETSKVLSMAGASHKIDVCTNFGYRAFSLAVC